MYFSTLLIFSTIALVVPQSEILQTVDALMDTPASVSAQQRMRTLLTQVTTPEVQAALAIRLARSQRSSGQLEQANLTLNAAPTPGVFAQTIRDEQLELARASGNEIVIARQLLARLAADKNPSETDIAEIFHLASTSSDVQVSALILRAFKKKKQTHFSLLLEAHKQLATSQENAALALIDRASQPCNSAACMHLIDDMLVQNHLVERFAQQLSRRRALLLCNRWLKFERPQSCLTLLRFQTRDTESTSLELAANLALRHDAEALGCAEKLINQGGPDIAAVELERARLLGRLGKTDEAIAAYEAFCNNHAGTPEVEQSSFFAAWLLHEAGRFQQAADAFAVYVFNRKGSAYWSKARWLWAFNLFRAERYDDAVDVLDRIITEEKGEIVTQAKYFKARAWILLGRPRAAVALLTEIARANHANVDTAGYYRELARAQLDNLANRTSTTSNQSCTVTVQNPGIQAFVANTVWVPLPPAPDACSTNIRAAFRALALRSDANQQQTLEAIALTRLCDVGVRYLQTLKPPKREPERRVFLDALYACGDLTRTLRNAKSAYKKILQGPQSAADNRVWQQAYPLHGLIQHAGDKSVEAALLLAVARQESHFLPKARSRVGAMGLLQLMPATGRQVALSLDFPMQDETDLLHPENNVVLARQYLTLLLQEYQGNLPLAVAAYNAGPHNVNLWVERFGSLPLDVFVESVPFLETRAYIKKVLTAYGVYFRLLHDSSSQPSWAQLRCPPSAPTYSVSY